MVFRFFFFFLFHDIIDLKQLIKDILLSFKTMIDKRIEVTSTCDMKEEIFLLGDKNLYSQIFLNLLINARDALEDKLHRDEFCQIQIKCKIQESSLSKDDKAKLTQIHSSHPNLKRIRFDKKRKLTISIIDNGTGIPKAIQGQIFDPFFTTKRREGKGSGLGLTIVYNSVTNLGGNIKVFSKEGEGTEFRLLFPILSRTSLDRTVKVPNKKQPSLAQVHDLKDLTILIIEDEKILRKTLKEFFSKTRASVWTAEDGLRGIRFYQQFPHAFDLIYLDINLPKMNGIEVSHRILKLNPSQKIIFITGYTDIKIPQQPNIIKVIKKPFDLKDLVTGLDAWFRE